MLQATKCASDFFILPRELVLLFQSRKKQAWRKGIINLKDHKLFLRENYTFLRHSFVDQPFSFHSAKNVVASAPLHTQDTEIGLGALV